MRRVPSASRQVAGACRHRVTRGRATHRLRRENLFPFHVGVEPATVRVLTEPDCCRINLRVPCEYSSAPRETLIRLSFASSPSVRMQSVRPAVSVSCSTRLGFAFHVMFERMSLWTFCFFHRHRHRHILLTSLSRTASYSTAWRSGNVVGRINEVTLRRPRLLLGWVTVFG